MNALWHHHKVATRVDSTTVQIKKHVLIGVIMRIVQIRYQT